MLWGHDQSKRPNYIIMVNLSILHFFLFKLNIHIMILTQLKENMVIYNNGQIVYII